MIALTRIDGRLIHGQVTVGYTRRYGANFVIVANDELAESTFQKNMMKMAAPAGTEIEIFSIDETAAIIKEDELADKTILLLVKSPIDLVSLIEKGCKFPKVNVGGVINEGATVKMTKEVIATEDELEAWKKLDEMGIEMELQWEISKNPANFNAVVRKTTK
jgi:mannose/fructose/N-acetylgalactosamine-specific phosphotransferase system component IIB